MRPTSSSPSHSDHAPVAPHASGIAPKAIGVVQIPNALGSAFDHGAFDARTRRLFITHTARDCVEVIDHDAQQHIATLPGFKGAAGVVVDDGQVLVTNRGAATIAVLDAETFKTVAMFETGPRPNGAAVVSRKRLAVVACIGDESEGPTLQNFARPASCKRPSRPVERFALLRSCDGVHNLGHRTRLQEGDRQRHYPAQQ
jgi:DNA-binding beta-propeller fold protein YncE